MKKLLVLLPILALAACGTVEIPEEPSPPIAPPTHIQPVESDLTPEPESDMNPLVELAIQDLAQRLGIAPQLVAVIDAKSITWPDASLGCPQEGMMYAQVETEGYQIFLEANQTFYIYHTETAEQVILCERPQLPVFPVTPGDIKDGEPWMPVD